MPSDIIGLWSERRTPHLTALPWFSGTRPRVPEHFSSAHFLLSESPDTAAPRATRATRRADDCICMLVVFVDCPGRGPGHTGTGTRHWPSEKKREEKGWGGRADLVRLFLLLLSLSMTTSAFASNAGRLWGSSSVAYPKWAGRRCCQVD